MIRISITAAAFQRGRGCEPSPLCASWQGWRSLLPRLGSFPFADLKTAVLGHFGASPAWLRENWRAAVGCPWSDPLPVRTEKEIAVCRAPAVSDPALRQMVRPIVQHMAALTERT